MDKIAFWRIPLALLNTLWKWFGCALETPQSSTSVSCLFYMEYLEGDYMNFFNMSVWYTYIYVHRHAHTHAHWRKGHLSQSNSKVSTAHLGVYVYILSGQGKRRENIFLCFKDVAVSLSFLKLLLKSEFILKFRLQNVFSNTQLLYETWQKTVNAAYQSIQWLKSVDILLFPTLISSVWCENLLQLPKCESNQF